jgi:hypothetical protein
MHDGRPNPKAIPKKSEIAKTPIEEAPMTNGNREETIPKNNHIKRRLLRLMALFDKRAPIKAAIATPP